MKIAQEKYKENIAEYILYMYQITDIIRAYKLDITRIQENIIAETADDSEYDAYTKWYEDLIKKMKSQEIQEKGILTDLMEIQMEILYLHNTLLVVLKDEKYAELFKNAEDNVQEFQKKSSVPNLNIIDTCFNALYFNLLMKLKGMEITPATQEAFNSISLVLAYLAKEFKDMRTSKGRFSINAN